MRMGPFVGCLEVIVLLYMKRYHIPSVLEINRYLGVVSTEKRRPIDIEVPALFTILH